MGDETRRSNNTALNALYVNSGYGLKRIIATDGTYTYICKALAGTATSEASWQIKRIEDETGNTTWCDSNTVFDNVQDNYSTLTYG